MPTVAHGQDITKDVVIDLIRQGRQYAILQGAHAHATTDRILTAYVDSFINFVQTTRDDYRRLAKDIRRSKEQVTARVEQQQAQQLRQQRHQEQARKLASLSDQQCRILQEMIKSAAMEIYMVGLLRGRIGEQAHIANRLKIATAEFRKVAIGGTGFMDESDFKKRASHLPSIQSFFKQVSEGELPHIIEIRLDQSDPIHMAAGMRPTIEAELREFMKNPDDARYQRSSGQPLQQQHQRPGNDRWQQQQQQQQARHRILG